MHGFRECLSVVSSCTRSVLVLHSFNVAAEAFVFVADTLQVQHIVDSLELFVIVDGL